MAVITADFLKSLGVSEFVAAQITAKQAESVSPAVPAVPSVPAPTAAAVPAIPAAPLPVSTAAAVTPAQPAPAVPAPAPVPPKEAPKAAEKPAESKPAATASDGQKNADPNEDLLARLEALERENNEHKAQLAARAYEDAVRAGIAAAGVRFSSKAAERDFYRTAAEKQFQFAEDGKTLTGFAEHLKAVQAAEPDMFTSAKPAPRFASGTPAAGQAAPQSTPVKALVNRVLAEQYGVKPEGAAAESGAK